LAGGVTIVVNDLTRRIRVFLLVGSRLLSETLTRILRKKSDIVVVGESAHCANVSGLIAQSETEMILMDSVTTPAQNLEFVSRIRHLYPNVQVLMIAADADESAFLKAVRAGVTGYLLKDASALKVITAIRTIARGEAVCPSQFCLALFKAVAQGGGFSPSLRSTSLGLTRRQQELLPMIARGLTNKEIASHLNLSEQTVKNHIHRMLRKVGASDRLHVIEIARVDDLPN
jgi:DNA-binding NarL/FixJ family response regulator